MKKLFFLLTIFTIVYSSSTIGKNCTIEHQKAICGVEYVCSNQTCSFCSLGGKDCLDYPNYECFYSDEGNICKHKNLFSHFSVFDGLSLFFVASALCAQSGVGGGGIFVPTLILIGGFSAQLSVAISKVIIFGGSISNFVSFGIRKHPHADRPLIDYDISLLIEPIILLGTIIGVYFNIIFPYWLVIILLLFLLAFTLYRTTQSGVKTWRAEKKQDEEEKLKNQESEIGEKKEDINVEVKEEVKEIKEEDIKEDVKEEDYKQLENDSQPKDEKIIMPNEPPKDNVSEELEKMLNQDKTRFPYIKILILVGCWILLVLTSLFKGGSNGIPSLIGIKKCSIWYWITVFSVFPVFAVITILVGIYLKKRYEKKVELNYPFAKGDIKYTTKTAFLIPFICLIAGIVSGLLGVGGGLVTGPILLELGVLPEISTSSSAFMILLTSSATVAQYAIFGVIPWDYGVVFWIVGILGSLCGQFIITYIVKRWGRPSWIIFLLIFVITLSSLCLIGLGIYNVVIDIKTGGYLGFKSVC